MEPFFIAAEIVASPEVTQPMKFEVQACPRFLPAGFPVTRTPS